MIDNLIDKDMGIQSNNFKQRLAMKKKKYKLSTSDMLGPEDDINNNLQFVKNTDCPSGKRHKSVSVNSGNGLVHKDKEIEKLIQEKQESK